MKKICFLIGNINLTGGTERVTSVVANGLCQENKYEVSILSLFEGMQPAFSIDSKISLFSLFKEKKSMKAMFLAAIWKIRQFVIQHKIDTLIVVDSISCVFTVPALFGLKIKHICWEHFNFKITLGTNFRNIGRKLSTIGCDKIIVLTSMDKIMWTQKYPYAEKKIEVISNPLPFKNDINNITSNLNSKIVLAVGRLVYEKGFDLLLDSWAKLKAKEEWNLTIVGSGVELDNLSDQAKILGIESSVSFVPSTNKIEEYYQKASFFCLPSRIEGFGMVIIEAQFFGLPVIAFDIETGPKELVVDNTGYLVTPYDTQNFSEKMFKLMTISQSLRYKMEQDCLNNVQKFNIKKILDCWKGIL